MLNENRVVFLRKAKIVRKCGKQCHIYIPEEYEGKTIVGVIFDEPTS